MSLDCFQIQWKVDWGRESGLVDARRTGQGVSFTRLDGFGNDWQLEWTRFVQNTLRCQDHDRCENGLNTEMGLLGVLSLRQLG